MKLLHLLLGIALGFQALSLARENEAVVSRGKIAEGTPWQTHFHRVSSDKNGPTVLIVGGMHGNEPAGSRAAEQILHWPIQCGTLVVVPRANVLALEAASRLTPNQPEEAANLNRNFPPVDDTAVDRIQPRGELASALWRFAMKVKPDWIIDLHEGYDFNRSHSPPKGKKKSVGSSIIYQAGPDRDRLVARMIAAADTTVSDPARKFSILNKGPVSTGLARACINVMGAEGLILETTYKGQPLSLRTRQHRLMVNVLLNHIGIIDRDCTDLLAAPRSVGNRIQVAMFDGDGTGPSREKLAAAVASSSNLQLHHIGPLDMRDQVLPQFDVLVFPGGSGSKQAGAIGEDGRRAVREFVRDGRGVVGVCAGAYLCSSHYRWSMNLIDSSVLTGSVQVPGKGRKHLWYRGRETSIDIELSEAGKRMYQSAGIAGEFPVRYCNGPIISPADMESLPDYRVLAWFRSENGLWEAHKGTMIDTPAIVSGNYGKGRVISISPHPEVSLELHPIIVQSILWAASAVN